jgi:hypothetical protein
MTSRRPKNRTPTIRLLKTSQRRASDDAAQLTFRNFGELLSMNIRSRSVLALFVFGGVLGLVMTEDATAGRRRARRCAPCCVPCPTVCTPATTAAGPVANRQPVAAETKERPRVLFAGKDLDNWERSNFGGEGELELKDGAVIFQRGADLTGMHWKGKPLPKINYEVTLEAQRIDGSDFFCGIVFPVNDSFCSFVAGGWGGSTIGLSSVDDIYAAENETGTYASFDDDKWYSFKLRVSDSAITAWIDGKQYVYLKTKGRKLSLHPAMEPAKPFGIAAFSTVAGIRAIKLRELTAEEIGAEAKEAAE